MCMRVFLRFCDKKTIELRLFRGLGEFKVSAYYLK